MKRDFMLIFFYDSVPLVSQLLNFDLSIRSLPLFQETPFALRQGFSIIVVEGIEIEWAPLIMSQ